MSWRGRVTAIAAIGFVILIFMRLVCARLIFMRLVFARTAGVVRKSSFELTAFGLTATSLLLGVSMAHTRSLMLIEFMVDELRCCLHT